MKIMRVFLKTLLLFCMILAIPLCVYAATDVDWKDEEKREDAWLTYVVTDWGSIDGLTFSENGSYSETQIDTDYVDKYQPIVQLALNECNRQGMYAPIDYQNLILTMMYYMDKHCDNDDTNDPAGIKQWINSGATINDQKTSIKQLYSRICECESAYNTANSDKPCDIFQNNAKLKGMIQSVIYPGYDRKYTKKSAKNYYKDYLKDNSTLYWQSSYHDFGSDVCGKYKAIKADSDSHIIIGSSDTHLFPTRRENG